jgi:hypothetical protein
MSDAISRSDWLGTRAHNVSRWAPAERVLPIKGVTSRHPRLCVTAA